MNLSSICPSCGVENLEGADECANCGTPLTHDDIPTADSQFETKLMELPLTALNLAPPRTIEADRPLREAIALLADRAADLVNVIASGRLVGVLSVRDLLTRLGADYQADLEKPVRQFMTPEPVSLPPEAPIIYALNKMDVGGHRHVPIVQDGRVLGLVSSRDVLAFILRNRRQTIVTRDKTQSHGPG